jgi:hypothetical protein
MNLSHHTSLLKAINSSITNNDITNDVADIGVSVATINTNINTMKSSLLNMELSVSDTYNLIESGDIDIAIQNISTKSNTIASNTGSIKTNTSNIDAIATNIEGFVDTVATNTTNINTYTTANNTQLQLIRGGIDDIIVDTGQINTSLNNIETDIDNINTNISTINTNISKNDKYNNETSLARLQWGGSVNYLVAGDYSSTTAKAYWQNTNGATILVKQITLCFISSETAWVPSRIFTSTSATSTSWLKYGNSSDGSTISTTRLNFSSNGFLLPYLSTVWNDPSLGSGVVYYGYQINDLNIPVINNDYFECEFSGNISGSGDVSLWTSIIYEKNTA